MPERPLRIFVAMPGTEMGPNAAYKDPEAVKANLLAPVVDKLQSTLNRQVDLVIEKDKRVAGVIHESMFAEARDADVYIADLTGANPNVYLELGVRWALRDKVTVLISQSTEDLRFNVFANRAILYYPDIIVKAAADVVEAIRAGLASEQSDSPVRAHSQYLAISKSDLDELHARIDQLVQERGEELLRLALGTTNLTERIELLRAAVRVNRAFTAALIELGTALREVADYPAAIESLKDAVRYGSDNPEAHRELGVTYSKAGEPALAAAALRRALELDPGNAETWSNLGGALRRVGMARAADGHYDNAALSESRDSYAEAHRLQPYDLYSALNVARLDILLSKWDPALLAQGQDEFKNEEFLCRHLVQQKPVDWWRRFDLGDALLFSGASTEARGVYGQAINLIPEDQRKDALGSVLGPLADLITAQVLDGDLLAEVKYVVAMIERAMPTA
jgi:Flp pilus assembly protein TadD